MNFTWKPLIYFVSFDEMMFHIINSRLDDYPVDAVHVKDTENLVKLIVQGNNPDLVVFEANVKHSWDNPIDYLTINEFSEYPFIIASTGEMSFTENLKELIERTSLNCITHLRIDPEDSGSIAALIGFIKAGLVNNVTTIDHFKYKFDLNPTPIELDEEDEIIQWGRTQEILIREILKSGNNGISLDDAMRATGVSDRRIKNAKSGKFGKLLESKGLKIAFKESVGFYLVSVSNSIKLNNV